MSAAAAAAGAAAGGEAFPSLVSADWLKENLGGVKVLNATWYLPNAGKDAVAEHKAERIPGALFFGALPSAAARRTGSSPSAGSQPQHYSTTIPILPLPPPYPDVERIADPASNLPHMLPSEAQFAAAADALGVGPDDALVVYDNAGELAELSVLCALCRRGIWWAAERRRLGRSAGAQAAGRRTFSAPAVCRPQACSRRRARGGPGPCLGTASEGGPLRGCQVLWHQPRCRALSCCSPVPCLMHRMPQGPSPNPVAPAPPPCPRVAVLDGGMPAWKAAGGAVETGPVDDSALHAAAQALRSPPPSSK